jgi:hypothetical protein
MTHKNEYTDGWFYAELCYADDIEYDKNEYMQESTYASSSQIDAWLQGYYDFWVTKNFSLD